MPYFRPPVDLESSNVHVELLTQILQLKINSEHIEDFGTLPFFLLWENITMRERMQLIDSGDLFRLFTFFPTHSRIEEFRDTMNLFERNLRISINLGTLIV